MLTSSVAMAGLAGKNNGAQCSDFDWSPNRSDQSGFSSACFSVNQLVLPCSGRPTLDL